MAKRKSSSSVRAATKRHANTRKASISRPAKLYPITKRDETAGEWFKRLVALQARLLAPGGCPWDREQTHQSLRKYLIEESYEALDAMDSGDPGKFAGELGDVLLQVVFHAVLAEREGTFNISDVVQAIHDKMVRRHPHVFGDAAAKDSGAVLRNWEKIKAEERAAEKNKSNGSSRKPESILSGVPKALPAALEAYQITRRAAHIGFDWDSLSKVLEKLEEEKSELLRTIPSSSNGKEIKPSKQMEEEVGDLLFTAANIARFVGVDPEIALKKANGKFRKRFSAMEDAALSEGKELTDISRERLEELWLQSKSNA